MIHLGNILEEIEFDSVNIVAYGTSYLLILTDSERNYYLNLKTEPINE
jgi:hypothetical protein